VFAVGSPAAVGRTSNNPIAAKRSGLEKAIPEPTNGLGADEVDASVIGVLEAFQVDVGQYAGHICSERILALACDSAGQASLPEPQPAMVSTVAGSRLNTSRPS
jgi:hypothetical protein